MRRPSWLQSWRGVGTLLIIVIAVLAVGGAGWGINNWLWQKGEIKRLNDKADADSTRVVSLEKELLTVARALHVAGNEGEVKDKMYDQSLAALERANLTARQNYDIAVSYRDKWIAATTPQPGVKNTFVPVELDNGELAITGGLTFFDHLIPAEIRTEIELEALLRRLGINLAIGEDHDGGLIAQVTTDSEHVESIDIKGITDLRTTGASRSRPGWFSGWSTGVLVGAGGVGVLWIVTLVTGG